MTALWMVWIIILSVSHIGIQIPTYYCEENRPLNESIIAQPINTWSNIGLFIEVWLSIFIIYYFKILNYFYWYGLLVPIIVLNLSVSSFIYHMIVSTGTGIWDFISILLYLSFEAGISISNVLFYQFNLNKYWCIHLPIWLLLFLIASLIMFVGGVQETYSLISGVLAGIFIAIIAVIEIGMLCISWLRYRKNNRVSNQIFNLVGIAITGGVACGFWATPTQQIYPCPSVIETWGHAIWHIVIAFTIFFLFLIRVSNPPTN